VRSRGKRTGGDTSSGLERKGGGINQKGCWNFSDVTTYKLRTEGEVLFQTKSLPGAGWGKKKGDGREPEKKKKGEETKSIWSGESGKIKYLPQRQCTVPPAKVSVGDEGKR